MSTALLAVTLSMLMGVGGREPAPSLRYWGALADGTNRARIQLRGQFADVRVGDRIPGWGTVRAVKPRELVVRRTLTEAEKQAREAEGLLAVDVLDMRIPLAVGQVASPAAPAQER
jgi:hypothetical protein